MLNWHCAEGSAHLDDKPCQELALKQRSWCEGGLATNLEGGLAKNLGWQLSSPPGFIYEGQVKAQGVPRPPGAPEEALRCAVSESYPRLTR